MSFKNLIAKTLKQIDFFGQPFQFHVFEKNQKLGTNLGGIYSILMILGILAYIAYMINEWTNNKIQTSVIQYKETRNFNRKFKLQQNFLNITILGLSPNEFGQNTFIFMPILRQLTHYDQNNSKEIQYYMFKQCSTNQSIYCLSEEDNSKIQLLDNNKQNNQKVYYSIYILKCNQSVLQNNQKCMKTNEIDQILQRESLIFFLDIFYQRFNLNTEKMESFQQRYPFYIDSTIYLATTIQLMPEKITYSNGYSFRDQKFEFFASAQLTTQILQHDTIKSRFENLSSQGFAEFYISISSDDTITTITKMSIFELCLEIFTFIRFAFWIGQIFSFYSSLTLEKKIIAKILKQQNKSKKDLQKEYKQITNIFNLLEYFQKQKLKKNRVKQKQNQHQDYQVLSGNLQDENFQQMTYPQYESYMCSYSNQQRNSNHNEQEMKEYLEWNNIVY